MSLYVLSMVLQKFDLTEHWLFSDDFHCISWLIELLNYLCSNIKIIK